MRIILGVTKTVLVIVTFLAIFYTGTFIMCLLDWPPADMSWMDQIDMG